jgi:hypothetical protein
LSSSEERGGFHVEVEQLVDGGQVEGHRPACRVEARSSTAASAVRVPVSV